MKRFLFTLVVTLFVSVNIFAQDFPASSDKRPSFSGYGLSVASSEESIFESEATSVYAGDYIKAADESKNETPNFGVGKLGDPGVPIVESILGLLGLGGAYAVGLFSRKRKED